MGEFRATSNRSHPCVCVCDCAWSCACDCICHCRCDCKCDCKCDCICHCRRECVCARGRPSTSRPRQKGGSLGFEPETSTPQSRRLNHWAKVDGAPRLAEHAHTYYIPPMQDPAPKSWHVIFWRHPEDDMSSLYHHIFKGVEGLLYIATKRVDMSSSGRCQKMTCHLFDRVPSMGSTQ